jgi:SAM-dependent methyltransferase
MKADFDIFGEEYSSLYDLFYQGKDYVEECKVIESFVKDLEIPVDSILDMGCGTGKHAILMAKKGYRVTGVDLSEEMISIAREKAENSKVDIRFLNGNMCNFDLNEKFDTVISMFSALGYLTNNSEFSGACSVARTHLKNKGLFLFDCWNGLAAVSQEPKETMREININPERKAIRRTVSSPDIANNLINVKIKVSVYEEGNMISETEEIHSTRYFFPEEIEQHLGSSGFKDITVFPFCDPENTLTEKDWNMQVTAIAA